MARLRWHEVFGKRVTIGGQDRILALARDITGREDGRGGATRERGTVSLDVQRDRSMAWRCGMPRAIVDTNPALWRMYGYSDGEFSALPPGSWTCPSYRPESLQAVDRRRIAALGSDGAAQGRLHLGARGARDPDAVSGKAARADHRSGHHREEALRRRARRGSANRCINAKSLLRSVRCLPASSTSSTIRFPSSWRGRCCSEEQGDSATQAAALKIRTAAERCARIVRTFLAMARQQQPERGPVAINDVVSAALDIASLRHSHEQHRSRARSRQRYSAYPRRRRSAPSSVAQLDHQRAAVAAGPARPRAGYRVTSRFDSARRRGLHHGRRQRSRHSGASSRAGIRALISPPSPRGRHGRRIGSQPWHRRSPWRHRSPSNVRPTGVLCLRLSLPVGAVEATCTDAEPSRKASAGQHTILVVDDEAGNSRSAGRDPDRRAASGGDRQFATRSVEADGDRSTTM